MKYVALQQCKMYIIFEKSKKVLLTPAKSAKFPIFSTPFPIKLYNRINYIIMTLKNRIV